MLGSTLSSPTNFTRIHSCHDRRARETEKENSMERHLARAAHKVRSKAAEDVVFCGSLPSAQ